MFESELKIIYYINILNDINRMHDNKVNNIAEYNLPHDIINISKRHKNINSNSSPIIHGCMNTRRIIGNIIIFESYLIVDVVSPF